VSKIILILNTLHVVDVLDDLKRKTIKDYNKFLYRLFKGYKDNYDHILNEINFIEISPLLDNRIKIY
jgi:hypothetical protein